MKQWVAQLINHKHKHTFNLELGGDELNQFLEDFYSTYDVLTLDLKFNPANDTFEVEASIWN